MPYRSIPQQAQLAARCVASLLCVLTIALLLLPCTGMAAQPAHRHAAMANACVTCCAAKDKHGVTSACAATPAQPAQHADLIELQPDLYKQANALPAAFLLRTRVNSPSVPGSPSPPPLLHRILRL